MCGGGRIALVSHVTGLAIMTITAALRVVRVREQEKKNISQTRKATSVERSGHLRPASASGRNFSMLLRNKKSPGAVTSNPGEKTNNVRDTMPILASLVKR